MRNEQQNCTNQAIDAESPPLRTFFVLIYDHTFGDLPNRLVGQIQLWEGFVEGLHLAVVGATNHEEAADAAIEQVNAEHDYPPTKDGGFSIVAVFDRADCQELADQLAENDKPEI
jgi:hypothetical protein